jgi:hypothetical protein
MILFFTVIVVYLGSSISVQLEKKKMNIDNKQLEILKRKYNILVDSKNFLQKILKKSICHI